MTYGYLWALDESTPLEDPAVARGAQLAEHAAAYLAQLSRQHDDEAYAVSDLISPDIDRVRRAVTRIEDRGLIDRRSPVVAVVVGALDEVVPHPVPPNPWTLVTEPVEPAPIGAGRSGPAHDDAPRAVASTSTMTNPRWMRPPWPCSSTAMSSRRTGRSHVVAGVGEPKSDLMELRASWSQARLAARVASAVPTVRPVARWADLGLYRLLAALPRAELASLILDAPVRRLLESPDPDLLHTVTSYLDHAGNVHDTAAELHIHRQTLYYRLGKAEALTGLRFDNGHDRVRLHIGLMLAPLLGAD